MATRIGRPALRLVPPARLERGMADELRRLILAAAGDASEVARELLAVVDRRVAASNGWRFVMVSPAKDVEVARWISAHAIRPNLSHLLWAVLKGNVHSGSNEVLMSRAEMMAATGARSPHISEALSELAGINAIERRKEGREVRWFINATVATHLTGSARDEAQQAAPQLLALMEGPPPMP